MRTKLMQLGTAAAIAALVASPSFAQTSTSPSNTAPSGTSNSPTTSSTGASGMSNPSGSHDNASSGATINATNNDVNKRDEVRASKFVGSTVYNDQNQSVGTVDDILMARDNKEPVQAIISVGGFLGIGSKLVEVPYDRLKLEANNKVVMPNASSDDLKKMQSFSYNTLDHSGTTNAGSASNGGTSSSSSMGTPSGAGTTTTTTTPGGTTHTTTTTPEGTTHSTTK